MYACGTKNQKKEGGYYEPNPFKAPTCPPICDCPMCINCVLEPNLVRIWQCAQIAHCDVRRFPLDKIRRNLHE